MVILDKEALLDRAGELKDKGLNGMKHILVKDPVPGDPPGQARLELHFHNNTEGLQDIKDTFDPGDKEKRKILTITGGHRVPAGWDTGQVHVQKVHYNPNDYFLQLIVTPIGDYSTYTLILSHDKIDPLFGKINFKFRPGCFNTDCAPKWKTSPAPQPTPVIDYLSKDYDSFKHTLINAMMERVPGWHATSEADLDQTLIDLFSAAADELSDYQDRVMNEAYLGTARKRVSLARHARLMDYHIHQGNQASTWLALNWTDNTNHQIPDKFKVWAGAIDEKNAAAVFMPELKQTDHYLHPLLNQLGLYTWDGSVIALEAGSTGADLAVKDNSQFNAETIRDLIDEGKVKYLLIWEDLDPATGKNVGARPEKRQLLKLLPDAEALKDPFTGHWYLRVKWDETTKLKHNYCFVIECKGDTKEKVSLFTGNLVRVFHGREAQTVFKAPGETLTAGEYHYVPTAGGKWGTLCKLPDRAPLAYRNTPPGGETPPRSTLEVKVEVGPDKDPWDEAINLIHSDDSSERGDHFMVETDEDGHSVIRFGNGTNGMELPGDAIVHCHYQVGRGPDGNIGADTLIHYDDTTFSQITKTWNPFDVIDGRAPEPVEEIIRRVPEAFRARQLRAVTLKDYEDRAMELDGVSQAAARYAWTGSWRTVRISIDPKGTDTLDRELKEKLARHLEAVRLMGEDIEIRPPRWVPLKIEVFLCVQPNYWPEDIKYILEQEFSDGYLPDGRTGFFHPDNWTFGQSLRASRITGRIQQVQGVDHVSNIKMNRYNKPFQKPKEMIAAGDNEIIRVKNDRDHMELGIITFDVRGGRQ